MKLNFKELTYENLVSELLPHLEQLKYHCLLDINPELHSISEHLQVFGCTYLREYTTYNTVFYMFPSSLVEYMPIDRIIIIFASCYNWQSRTCELLLLCTRHFLGIKATQRWFSHTHKEPHLWKKYQFLFYSKLYVLSQLYISSVREQRKEHLNLTLENWERWHWNWVWRMNRKLGWGTG